MRAGYGCQLVSDRSFGVSNCILGLARALATTANGSELYFYVRRLQPSLPSEGQVLAAGMTNLRVGRILWDQLVLPGRAARDRLDVYHAPGYVMPLRMRVPTVLTIYDLLALTHPQYCKPTNRWHYGLAMPCSVRRARRIIACSHAVRKQLLERFPLPPERVCVVHPGVDDAFRTKPTEEELARTRRKYSLHAPFALFVGNHEPKKNLPALVAAFRRLRERKQIDGELVLSGGGEGWGSTVRDLPASAGVHHLPYVPRADLRHLYRLARLLVFPSLAEGFGLPVLEAMASGLPVVCSSIPAVEDTDPRAVFLVDPRAEDSIGQGLLAMWTDSELRATASRLGLLAAERFTWERAARQTWGVYHDVANA